MAHPEESADASYNVHRNSPHNPLDLVHAHVLVLVQVNEDVEVEVDRIVQVIDTVVVADDDVDHDVVNHTAIVETSW